MRARLVRSAPRAARLGCLAAAVGAGCAEPAPIPLGCDGVVERVRGEPGIHVPIGSSIEWSTNPPATGMHYPVWAKWNHHYPLLDRGYWIHNAEHGGIVLLYRCPEGCPDVVASLIEVVRGFSADAACTAPVRNRLLVVADPLLPDDVQVAAVGWNATYTASCFDPFVAGFARANYRKAPEDLCADGAGLGGEVIDRADPAKGRSHDVRAPGEVMPDRADPAKGRSHDVRAPGEVMPVPR